MFLVHPNKRFGRGRDIETPDDGKDNGLKIGIPWKETRKRVNWGGELRGLVRDRGVNSKKKKGKKKDTALKKAERKRNRGEKRH